MNNTWLRETFCYKEISEKNIRPIDVFIELIKFYSAVLRAIWRKVTIDVKCH